MNYYFFKIMANISDTFTLLSYNLHDLTAEKMIDSTLRRE